MKVDENIENTPLKEQKKTVQMKKAPFSSMFRYATKVDYLFILIGTAGAMVMGATQPFFFFLMCSIFGKMGPDTTHDEYYDNAVTLTYAILAIGGIFTIASYLAVASYIHVGSRMSYHYRIAYFKAVMNCDPEWFDLRQISEIPQSITSDTLKIERATGDKLVILIFTASMILASFILALVRGTQLTLICFLFGPFAGGGMYLTNNGMEQSAKAADTSYKTAGGIAEEALQEVKTVSVLNGQKHETKKYSEAIEESRKAMLVSGLKIGCGTGIGIASFLFLVGVIYIVGAIVVDRNEDNWADGEPYDIGRVMMVIWITIMAFNNIGTCVPSLKIVLDGRTAAYNIIQVLSTKSNLDNGENFNEIKGSIEFKDVKFSYPSSPSTEILKGISFSLKHGQRLGIAGMTGSGKSTIIQLLLRFYEPKSGSIMIDGIDIRQFAIKDLRENIGLVSQEPLLFNTSIYENIRYGKKDAKMKEIEKAAKEAGILDFIENLPDKFETSAGAKGSQLSGGQKQRIAIARAIIRNPKILLLDEATSALDRTTEISVMEALDRSLGDCTRLTVAQNLLTIKNSTYILMMDQGVVEEFGRHKDLMRSKGKYYHLVKMQRIHEKNIEENDINPIIELTDFKPEETAQKSKDDEEKKAVRKKMLKMGRSEWGWLALGVLGSILVGCAYPIVGTMTGQEIETIAYEHSDMVEQSTLYGGMIFLLSGIVFFGLLMQSVSYPKMTSNITARMRDMSFRAMLSYEAAFFDLPENNCSVLSSRLSNDCERVNGLGGSVLGITVGIVTSLAVAHGVGAYFSWRLTLVVLATVPLIIFATSSTYMAQFVGLVKFDFESCASYAADAILNIKTVKAFNLEDIMLERYMEPVKAASAAIKTKAHVSGLSYGLGFGLVFMAQGLIFWYGAKLVKDNTNSFGDMSTAMITAMNASAAFFLAGIYAPDVKNGVEAAKRLFKILEYTPSIDVGSKEGTKKPIEGKIEFNNVTFSYPNRNYQALKEVSFTVNPGTNFAIIGRTGSGKTTVVQLILRLYDPSVGTVFIDNIDIKSLNLKDFRKQIGIVSQEPVLFSGTISENIAYGIRASNEQVKEAAEKAQALEFISSKPDGFDYQVGIKGSKLSGGQKQRIAIARAIIRNPKLLILDEATSALDSGTETELLGALSELMKERTCITIAHRLKTISDADIIMVLDSGKVIEFGSRDDLMSQGGYFYNMISNL